MDGLMKGKRGLIMGVANDHSIAWGIAQKLAEQGAELAFTYQGEAFGRRVKPLAEKVGASLVLPCDVEDSASIDSVFDALAAEWGKLDFVVHAIGFSDKNELKGLYADTTRENFIRTMVISCYSFTEVARKAAAMMEAGGSMITLTYAGSVRVMPNYNVMGVAKAGLEASVRYLANDYGPRGIRVNAHLRRTGADVGGRGHFRRAAHVLLSAAQFAAAAHGHDRRSRRLGALSACPICRRGVTGEIHYVDSGYHIVSMPTLDELKRTDDSRE